ncbi:MAG: outer rane beta-barrel protein [Flaviaesturariibacter sp.]|nr:outer rane beta-barrel protein [Flaviaesturariibacter sp.]
MRPVLFIFAVLLGSNAFSQTTQVKGSVLDSFNNVALENATIKIIRSKDSILIDFARTNKTGYFELMIPKSEKFILICSYPGFVDYIEQNPESITAEGKISKVYMTPQRLVLQEVVVRQQIGAIRMRGDTTEYKVDSFKLSRDATVEEMLRVLPGIQVDSKGVISVQGRRVKQVLVDGEEFFSEDPTLVTQNFKAASIDKVQVFDKKSDQAAFTGIDDGKRSKTINLKLKETAKQGHFGNSQIGVGNESFYDGRLFFSKFRKKEKFAVYSIYSNTGTAGLSENEEDTYGDNTGLGFSSFYHQLDDWSGVYGGQGIPYLKTIGLHYDNKWESPFKGLNSNLKYYQLNVKERDTLDINYNLPGKTLLSRVFQDKDYKLERKKVNSVIDVQLDSTSTLKISLYGEDIHKTTLLREASQLSESGDKMLNISNRHLSTDGSTTTLSGSALWRKRFQKKGRTVSLNFLWNRFSNDGEGYINSEIKFYNGMSTPQTIQSVDQLKTNEFINRSINVKAIYTEPLLPKTSLIINGGFQKDDATAQRLSFDRSSTNKYDLLDSFYSNEYTFKVTSGLGGLQLVRSEKKRSVSVGSDIAITKFDQLDIGKAENTNRNFVNWYPKASLNLVPNPNNSIVLSYTGATIQPLLHQIQPLYNNIDPLNIVVGNPSLKPTFNSTFRIMYIKFQPLKQKSLWADLSYLIPNQGISTNESIDASGKRQIQFINVNGNRVFKALVNYNFQIKEPKVGVGVNTTVNNAVFQSIINNEEVTTRNNQYQISVGLSKSKPNKWEFNISNSISYNRNASNLKSTKVIDYWLYSVQPLLEVHATKKMRIHTDGYLMFRSSVPGFTQDRSLLLWNAWIDQKIIVDKLSIRGSVNDILNNNNGLTRLLGNSYVIQSKFNTIRRYFMITAYLKINHTRNLK